MCGLAGIFDTRGQRPIDRTDVERMTNAVMHRGPDGAGMHLSPGTALGHRRLSIIDPAGGHQPMYNEDDTIAIVYNGEIYHFKDLVHELTALGHRFRTHCDTEVVIHAWEQWGVKCLDRLRGMFAFALWDERRQTLFIARDRLGEKPLYYSLLDDGTLIFGSELKALLTYPGLQTKLDMQAVEEYFAFGYVPEPRSIYRGIAKLPAAHYLEIRRGAPVPAPQPYWDVTFRERGGRSESEDCEELIALLRDSVKGQMVADVPLGAFLSGGVDSSGVVAMMAGIAPEHVNTFSISFGERAFDESRYADAMAKRYGTNHRSRRVDPDQFDLVDSLARIYDEPFGDSSALPTLRLSAMTREHVTVALSGDGGDELFAGYRRYLWHAREERVRRIVPAALRGPAFGALARLYPKLDWAPRAFRAKTTFQELALDALSGYFSSVSVVNDPMRNRLFSDRMRRDLQGYHAKSVLERHMGAAGTDDPLGQAQYVDLKTWLPGDILVKVDRASMACSLEVRVPLLDHRVVEWAASLPHGRRLKGREGKFILKRALEPYVSGDILYRPKQGFSVPLSKWFRGPLHDRLRAAITDATLGDTGMFDTGFIATLLDQHRSGVRDHAAVLWVLLGFAAFLRNAESARPAVTSSHRPLAVGAHSAD
ncbi:MAG TPA: XrtA/PEP-CTERM system amidotransferase [Candidatus Cybelea sp.]|nr:XrtA/PEP-CTERM system amidotransferase [Candidatus Cybelea sp.]